ncbi:MAG: hypothetical protein ACTSQ8_25615, partial [Candidatus Helarchaeota archaeon]
MRKIKLLKLSKPRLHRILLIITLVYFIVFGILMVHTSGQPDQAPHFYFSRRYSETWGFPEENLNIKFTVTGQPYLYYWINGAIYKIFQLIFPNERFQSALIWRLMSVFYSTITVLYTYKLAAKVTDNPYAGVLAAFFL